MNAGHNHDITGVMPGHRDRGVPGAAGPAGDPDREFAHHPDGLQRPEPAAGTRSVHVQLAAGRHPDHVQQRRVAPHRRPRSGGRPEHSALAVVHAQEQGRPAPRPARQRSRRARDQVHAHQSALRSYLAPLRKVKHQLIRI